MMRRNISQHSQWWFYSGLLLLLFGTVPLCYLSISSLRSVNAQRTEVTEKYARALGLTNHLRYHQSHEYALELQYSITHDKNLLPQIDDAHHEFIRTVKWLKEIDPSQETVAMLDNILNEHVNNLNEKLTNSLDKYFDYELTRMTLMRDKVNQLSHRLDNLVVSTSIVTTAGFLFIVVLLFRLSRSNRSYQATREELYREVERSSQIRKEVLESVSHDLKNPISTIKLGSQMLMRILEQTENEKVQLHLHRIENSTKVMQTLIDDLMDSVKVESGNLELDLHPENPLEIVRSALDEIATLAEAKDISLEFESSPLFHFINCDRKRIQQVFSNLLGNALKFTPAQGQIKVSVFEEDDRTCFLIKDTGAGIAKENIPHLFDRFWQADKKGKLGTGIGLSIVKGIVEKHGGVVAVKSTAGEGSSFIFSVPFAELTHPAYVPQEVQSQILS